MKSIYVLTFLILLVVNLMAQDVIRGNAELLKKINSFPEEYVNKKIILNDIWVWCNAEKVLKSDYYSISVFMRSNESLTIDAYGSNLNCVMTKKLTKYIINDDDYDTRKTKYFANIYGEIKKNVYWHAQYTLIINKIEFMSYDGTIMETFK
jgi:hypothetical protein